MFLRFIISKDDEKVQPVIEFNSLEIGDTFDLSRERVRQIREKAIRRLRQTSKSHILKKYLG